MHLSLSYWGSFLLLSFYKRSIILQESDICCQRNTTPVSSRTVFVSTNVFLCFFCVCFPASAVIACLHTLQGQMAGEKAFSHQSEGTTGLPHQSRERQSVFPFLVSFRLLCDGRLKGNWPLILGELAALGSSHSWREGHQRLHGENALWLQRARVGRERLLLTFG